MSDDKYLPQKYMIKAGKKAHKHQCRVYIVRDKNNKIRYTKHKPNSKLWRKLGCKLLAFVKVHKPKKI